MKRKHRTRLAHFQDIGARILFRISTSFFLASTLVPGFLQALEVCTPPRNAADVLACVQARHPDVQRSLLKEEQAQVLIEVASQIPNPELGVEPIFGSTRDGGRQNIEIALLQPVELGGKRSTRQLEAQARLLIAKAELTGNQVQATLQTVLKLHRLRQIQIEMATADDGVDTFSKLIHQYRTRRKLPPEQEVSLVVFQIAKADYDIRRTVLLEEERSIETFFRIASVYNLSDIKKVLPVPPQKWPEIQDNADASQTSPRALQAQAAQKLALAELESAQSASWPDLRVGPKVQFEKDGVSSTRLYGVSLSIALPVWNRNLAGREYAERVVHGASKSLELSRFESVEERAELVKIYRGAAQSLKDTVPLSEIQKKHEGIDRHFLRGLISSSLVVEAHRQMSDLQKSRHEREAKAIDALWRIYALDGRILKEIL